MQRLRYSDVKPVVARVMNTDTNDPKVLEYSNEAHRRCVMKTKAVGTMQRYRICTNSDGCFAWPRSVDTIEGWWLCDTPGTLRNGFYESSINGPGYLDSQDMQTQTMIDRDPMCVFSQPNNTTSTVMVQSDLPEAAGTRILIRGYDGGMTWVRTEDPPGSNTWIDGEYVAITNGSTYSLHPFSRITAVIKPVTLGNVRLWQNDLVTGLVQQLAYYEPDETLPIYRCSLVPGLGNVHGCGENSSVSGTCQPNRVTVLVKLRHIDARSDNDLYLLGNLASIKLMVMAILKEERNLFEESMAYEAKALKELNDELATFQGDGVVPIIKTESPQTWGAGVLSPLTMGYRLYRAIPREALPPL